MNNIYIYDGPFETGEKGYALIKRAVSQYCQEANLDFHVEEAELIKEEKGKPCFVHIPVNFSLTHSEHLWMCLVSQKPCGLDLQVVKPCSFEKIARRNYTVEEQHYVDLWGQEGFFDLWVRKEAFCKFTGQGFFTDMPSMVDKKNDLLEEIVWNDATYFLQEIIIADYLKCAVCTGEKVIIEMRSLA